MLHVFWLQQASCRASQVSLQKSPNFPTVQPSLQLPVSLMHPFLQCWLHVLLQNSPNMRIGQSPRHPPVILSQPVRQLLQFLSHSSPYIPSVQLMHTPLSLKQPFLQTWLHTLSQNNPNLPTGQSPSHCPASCSQPDGQLVHCLSHSSP